MLDEATAAAEAMTLARAQRARRRASVVLRRRRRAIRRRSRWCAPAPRRSASRSRWRSAEHRTPAAGDCFGVLLQYPDSAASCTTDEPLIDARCTRRRLVVVAADLLALTLLVPPGELGRRHRRRHRPSASACRWASAARTPPTWPRATSYKRSLPGRLVGRQRRRARARRPTAWPCRRASSTSGARRRPATSAPRRCCWR